MISPHIVAAGCEIHVGELYNIIGPGLTSSKEINNLAWAKINCGWCKIKYIGFPPSLFRHGYVHWNYFDILPNVGIS